MIHDKPNCVKILLAYGADPNLKMGSNGDTTLDWVNKQGSEELKELINSHQGNFDPNEPLMQQMMLMIKMDREDQVKRILDKEEVDVNEQLTMVKNPKLS